MWSFEASAFFCERVALRCVLVHALYVLLHRARDHECAPVLGVTGVALDPPPLPDPGVPLVPDIPLVPEVLPDPTPEGNGHGGATDDVLALIL